MRVLLVEDSEDDAVFMQETLLEAATAEAVAIDVVHATTLAEARGLAQSEAVDVIALDLSLPDSHGLDTFRTMARVSPIPIVLLTGLDDRELAARAMAEGCQDYLVKGDVKGTVLLRALQYACERSALHSELERRVEEQTAELRQRGTELSAKNQALAVEIRERKQAEGVLRVFEEVADNIPLGLLILERRGPDPHTGLEVALVNPAARRLLDLAPDRPVPRQSLCHLLREARGPDLCELLSAAEREGPIELGRQSFGKTASGSNRVYDVRGFALPEHRFGVSLEDISDRVRLEQQFLHAQKMEALGRLAGGVAHDLNNVFTALVSYASFVLDALDPAQAAHDDQQQVLEIADRGVELVRQLLAFARRQPVSPKVVHVNNVVWKLEKMLDRILGSDVDLLIDAPDAIGPVQIDPGQLEQVLVNLSVNARDAMPAGGRLTIEVAETHLDASYSSQHLGMAPGVYVMLAVSDNGVGMEEAVRSRVFEPFFTTKGEAGTGLGLATSYGIVRQAGGHIWFYSELGKGTTFKIYLPRSEAAPTAPAVSRPAQRASRGETILVTEDDAMVRQVSLRTLRRQGYEVLEADSAESALSLAEQTTRPIALLVTDLVMPGLSGGELFERIRTLHPETRVLFVSGYASQALKHQGQITASQPFLPKPFDPQQLAERVRSVLDGGE